MKSDLKAHLGQEQVTYLSSTIIITFTSSRRFPSSGYCVLHGIVALPPHHVRQISSSGIDEPIADLQNSEASILGKEMFFHLGGICVEPMLVQPAFQRFHRVFRQMPASFNRPLNILILEFRFKIAVVLGVHDLRLTLLLSIFGFVVFSATCIKSCLFNWKNSPKPLKFFISGQPIS